MGKMNEKAIQAMRDFLDAVGVDIGAKYDIYNLTKKLAESGLAVIIISDDIREVLLNCNRVLIMRRGHLVDERMTKDLDEETLSKLSVEY